MSKLVKIVVLALLASCHCDDNFNIQEIELQPEEDISGTGYTSQNERSDNNFDELSYDFPAVRNKAESGQYPVSIPVAKLNKTRTDRQLPFHPAMFLQQQQQQQALAMAQLNPQLYSNNYMQFGGVLPNIAKRQDTDDDDISDEDEFGSEELPQFNFQRGVFPPGIFSPFGPGFRSGLNDEDLKNSSSAGEALGSLNLTTQRRPAPVFSKLENNSTSTEHINSTLNPIREVRPPVLSKLGSGKPEKDEIQVGSEQIPQRVPPPFFARLGLPSDSDNQPQPILQHSVYNQPLKFGFHVDRHDGSSALNSESPAPLASVFDHTEPSVYEFPKASNRIPQTPVFSNLGGLHTFGEESSVETTTPTEARLDLASSDSEPELPDEPPRKHIARIPVITNISHGPIPTGAPHPAPPSEGSSEVFHAYFPANTSMEDTRSNTSSNLLEQASKANKPTDPIRLFNRMPFDDTVEHADVIKSVKRRHAGSVTEDDENVSTTKPGKLQVGQGMKLSTKRKPVPSTEDSDHEGDSQASAAPNIACTSYRNCRCGGSVTKIVTAGAVNVQTNLYPWLVSVNANGQHLCAGNIISSNYVLTAASCVSRHAPKSLQIAAALTSRQPQHLSVSKVLNPPNDDVTKSDRLVLLKIQGNLQPGRHIKFVCLPQNATDIEQKRGMLVTFTHDFSTNKLTLLQLPTDRLSAQKCEENLASEKTKFCTSPRKRTCEANIGGSFVVRGKQYSSVLLGVNTGSPGCKKNGNPTTYTYVHPYLDWIIKETANHNTVFCKNPNVKDGCSLSRVLDEENFDEDYEDYAESEF